MNRITKVIYWTGLSGVWCFASLYLAAAFVAPTSGLQIAGMLGMAEGSNISMLYARFYTALLILTALLAIAVLRYPLSRYATLVLAGSVLGLTILPVLNSLMHDYRPSFYEHYIGEGLTILSLILLSVGVVMAGQQTKEAQQVAAGQPATTPRVGD